MRDDREKWAPHSAGLREDVRIGELSMSEYVPRRLSLISGPMRKALAFAGVESAVSWPAPSFGDRHALALRRDRILVANGDILADGWHDDHGLAVSDVTSGYRAATLSGRSAFDVLKRGTEVSLARASGSVARGFAGYPVFLHAVDGPDRYRLYTPRALFDGVWALLCTFGEQAATGASPRRAAPTLDKPKAG